MIPAYDVNMVARDINLRQYVIKYYDKMWYREHVNIEKIPKKEKE